ncbi:MAG TPA: hypothetical protein VFW42_09365 [Fluviicoccus sp.]|nr:hypothetical protein [Fluviicoccus sp.]
MIRAAVSLSLLMLAVPVAAEPAAGPLPPASTATMTGAATTPTPKPAPIAVVSAGKAAQPETPPPVRGSNGNIVIDASLTPAQRAEQDLLANAKAMDRANLELQARNQTLQLQNENLNLQVKLLQQDQSADGIRNGALAAIAGVLLGWFLAGAATRRARKHSW